MRYVKWGRYSPVGWLNVLACQWLFFRLQMRVDDKGQISKINVIGPIVPLTGWWSDYIWLKKKRS